VKQQAQAMRRTKTYSKDEQDNASMKMKSEGKMNEIREKEILLRTCGKLSGNI